MTNYNESENGISSQDNNKPKAEDNGALTSKESLTGLMSVKDGGDDAVNADFMQGLKADDSFASFNDGGKRPEISDKKEPEIKLNLRSGNGDLPQEFKDGTIASAADAIPEVLRKPDFQKSDATTEPDSLNEVGKNLQSFKADEPKQDQVGNSDKQEPKIVEACNSYPHAHESLGAPNDEKNPLVGDKQDDPDKVPVVPTLSDDEVPNMPGAILMHARELLGLSQRDVANRLLLRVNTISDIEHDRLNQPTAESFVSSYIANYAKLVNIDPEVLVTLYRQNVSKNVREGALHFAENKGRGRLQVRKSGARLAAGCALIALVAVGAYWFVSGFNDDSQHSDGLTGSLTPAGQSASFGESGELKLDENPFAANRQERQMQSIDPNTARAREQTLALHTNDLITDPGQSADFAADKSVKSEDLPVELKTSSGPAVVRKNADRRLSSAQEQAKVAESVSSNLKTVDLQRPQSKPSGALAVPLDRKGFEGSQDGVPSKGIDLAVNADDKAAETAPVKLSGNLKDISKSARLSGRQGLESMNNATVKALGSVVLKITDSRGKVLSQGSFKAGDVIRVTGIPPIKVSVSESSKIKVSYMGGTVSVPDSKQVSFALPQR